MVNLGKEINKGSKYILFPAPSNLLSSPFTGVFLYVSIFTHCSILNIAQVFTFMAVIFFFFAWNRDIEFFRAIFLSLNIKARYIVYGADTMLCIMNWTLVFDYKTSHNLKKNIIKNRTTNRYLWGSGSHCDDVIYRGATCSFQSCNQTRRRG